MAWDDESDGRRSEEPLRRSARELDVRRGAARRRRTRRRGAGGGVLVLLVGVLVVALTGGSGRTGVRRGVGGGTVGAASSRVRVPGQDAVGRVLGYTSYVARAGGHRREVALTFDDGPGPSTRRIVRILEQTRTPATFFVVGRSARADPQAVAAEAKAGFVVGDHTETHALLGGLSGAAQAREIDAGARDIQQAGAPYPRLVRPPYGSFDDATLGLLRARGMLMVLWSADTKDFTRPGAKRIAYTGISGGQPGAIILMHDGGPDRGETASALPRIIERLRQRGYRLVTVLQLIADDPPRHGQPRPRRLSGAV